MRRTLAERLAEPGLRLRALSLPAQIALAVLVENGGFGAESAAPIARQVLDYYLLGKLPAGIAPEYPGAEGTTGDNAGD